MTNIQKQIYSDWTNRILQIRAQEISAELNLRHTYPGRSILLFQETEAINPNDDGLLEWPRNLEK